MAATDYLDRLIDYAGTFPPAALDLEAAVAEYRRLKAGGTAWMVGPLLVRSLDVAAAGELLAGETVDLAVALVGPSLADDLDLVARRPPSARLVQLEARLPLDPDVVTAGRSWGDGVVLYGELAGAGPLAGQVAAVAPLARALAGVAEVRVKVRTGGPTADAVPSPTALAELVVACHQSGLAFKATAGLHAPYRHFDEATAGDQHGFLNLLAASALAAAGVPAAGLIGALEARTPKELSAAWAQSGVAAGPDQARRLFRSFGSCSAAEPIEHLESFGLLAADGSLPAPGLW